MRRTLHLSVAVCGALIALLVTAPAWAHTATEFFPRPWAEGQRGSVWIYNDPNLTGTFLTRVLQGAKTWDNTGQSLNFARASKASLSRDVCDPKQRNRNLVYNTKLDGAGGNLGATYVCYTSTNTVRFTMAFDTADKWYTGTSKTVPKGLADVISVATHEFGHAAGWSGHYDDALVSADGASCANNSGQQTMCSRHWVGTARQRSLSTHDLHTFKAAY